LRSMSGVLSGSPFRSEKRELRAGNCELFINDTRAS
jgi:hypothetical protein